MAGVERIFVMPDLGEGLADGDVNAWMVAEGDVVELNQPLVEVETAKAAVEVPSPYAGRIVRLHAEEGDAVPVGSPLVTFEVEEAAGGAGEGGPRATPPVRRLAKELAVELAGLAGSGPGGRITDTDVRAAVGAGSDPVEARAAEFEVRPITPTRRAIAERLTASVEQIPHVTTFRTLDATALTAFRETLGISPLPIVVRALATVCERHPILHASWHGDLGEIHVPRRCDVAVAIDTERGLLAPVVRDVGARGIGEIDTEIRRLAEAARDASLPGADLTGGTITLSNTGSYGSESGTPIITPGQGAIVALGVIRDTALVVDGKVLARQACTLSLSFDHRLMDGADAGRALTDLVDLLGSTEKLEDLPR
jgi:pyruvate dehydrogenase E2 component (dihydrolipoamide acetyltransferase)